MNLITNTEKKNLHICVKEITKKEEKKMEIVCFDFHPPANLQEKKDTSKPNTQKKVLVASVFPHVENFFFHYFTVFVLFLPLLVSMLTLVEFFNTKKKKKFSSIERKNNKNFQLYLTAKLESNYRPLECIQFFTPSMTSTVNRY